MYFLLLKDFFKTYFYSSAAGVVSCGGRKKSPRTSSIVQIIFNFGPLRPVLLPLFQEGQLSVTGESMCTKYWLTA